MAHLVCDVEHPAELEAALVEDLVLGDVDLGRVVGLERQPLCPWRMALAGRGSLRPITRLQARQGTLGECVPLCESVVASLSLPHLVSGSDRPEAGRAHLHLTVAGRGRPAVRGCTEPGYGCFTEEQASENSPVIFEFN